MLWFRDGQTPHLKRIRFISWKEEKKKNTDGNALFGCTDQLDDRDSMQWAHVWSGRELSQPARQPASQPTASVGRIVDLQLPTQS